MKAALIPPIPNLALAQGREYHLLLVHLLRQSQEYLEFYRKEKAQGSYLILDNSAHEYTQGQSIETLLQVGTDLGVDELVVPDYLFSNKRTAVQAQESLDYLAGPGSDLYVKSGARLMLVPQGEDPGNFFSCLVKLAMNYKFMQVHHPQVFTQAPVIGVSKDYEMWPGGLLRVLELLVIPAADELGADIHLLGWGRDLWALSEIARVYGDRIRSVDSAKPFVYGVNGITLDVLQPAPPYPRRTPTYFEVPLVNGQVEASLANVQIFDALARGEAYDPKLSRL